MRSFNPIRQYCESRTRRKKVPERRAFGYFLWVFIRLRLADLVDVTGQVDHLVGEAPLVVWATAYPPLFASLTRTSRTA